MMVLPKLQWVVLAFSALVFLPVETTGAARQQTDPSAQPSVNRWIGSRTVQGIRANGPNIELEPGSGWLFTSGLYGDFTLSLEFRILMGGTDAGLFVRSVPGDKPTGYRISLSDYLDDHTVAGLGAGSNGFHPVPFQKETLGAIARPQAGDEWHSMEVKCEGPRLSVKLNGTPVASLDRIAPSVGVIGLAGHRGRLEVRSIRVVRLNQVVTPPLLADSERGVFKTDAGNGVASPKLTREVKPNYTAGAMARKVEGVVWLEAIVLPDGTIGEVRVTRELDLELDQEAIATVKKWRFTPGSKNGVPVAVLIEIEMSFTLRK